MSTALTPTPVPKTRPSVSSGSASRENPPSREATFQALRGLGIARDDVVRAYRRFGGTQGWRSSDVAAMARAITHVEDSYELLRQTDGLQRVRTALRDLRRRLEVR